MKKIVALTGVVGFLAVVLVFSACATMSTWWSGPWIWGATMLLSEGQDGQTENFEEKGDIHLSGSNQNPSGVFVDANKEEYVMTEIDLSKKGLILFVVNGEQKEGEFDFENGRIIEK
jgi:hypothetical protein